MVVNKTSNLRKYKRDKRNDERSVPDAKGNRRSPLIDAYTFEANRRSYAMDAIRNEIYNLIELEPWTVQNRCPKSSTTGTTRMQKKRNKINKEKSSNIHGDMNDWIECALCVLRPDYIVCAPAVRLHAIPFIKETSCKIFHQIISEHNRIINLLLKFIHNIYISVCIFKLWNHLCMYLQAFTYMRPCVHAEHDAHVFIRPFIHRPKWILN